MVTPTYMQFAQGDGERHAQRSANVGELSPHATVHPVDRQKQDQPRSVVQEQLRYLARPETADVLPLRLPLVPLVASKGSFAQCDRPSRYKTCRPWMTTRDARPE